jgi:hypothetical protein
MIFSRAEGAVQKRCTLLGFFGVGWEKLRVLGYSGLVGKITKGKPPAENRGSRQRQENRKRVYF